ncbi:hypothetical protein IHE56_04360 [Streptomyces sp. ID01-12c]|uniref:hypothetical protein n=1 Tax=Streptomyces caniscabiei TaxID=2746961 RepID=UPI00177D2DD2|nr:hypothetical protein [Streptomyces caniscabiei]MBD9701336.1 hypothetical protein [Streptomyces caniscabiei]MDX3726484.1 hypothetical protein [Streptomyces caniscabiei]
MEQVTIAAGLAVAGELLRLSCAWMSARSYRRRVEREVARAEQHRGILIETIGRLPAGSEIIETLPDGRRITIKLPGEEAA